MSFGLWPLHGLTPGFARIAPLSWRLHWFHNSTKLELSVADEGEWG